MKLTKQFVTRAQAELKARNQRLGKQWLRRRLAQQIRPQRSAPVGSPADAEKPCPSSSEPTAPSEPSTSIGTTTPTIAAA